MRRLNYSNRQCCKTILILLCIEIIWVLVLLWVLDSRQAATVHNTYVIEGEIYNISHQVTPGRKEQVYFSINKHNFYMQWLDGNKYVPQAVAELSALQEPVKVTVLSERTVWGREIAIAIDTGEKQYGGIETYNRYQRAQRVAAIILFVVFLAIMISIQGYYAYLFYHTPRAKQYSGVIGFVKWLLTDDKKETEAAKEKKEAKEAKEGRIGFPAATICL